VLRACAIQQKGACLHSGSWPLVTCGVTCETLFTLSLVPMALVEDQITQATRFELVRHDCQWTRRPSLSPLGQTCWDGQRGRISG
jgi:hypothetical protein